MVYLNDNTIPVKCKYEEVWDYINEACIAIENYQENLFRFKTSASRLLKINNVLMGSKYSLEYWYKAADPTSNCIIYEHSEFSINITDDGQTYDIKTKPGNSPILHEVKDYDSKQWNHLLVIMFPHLTSFSYYACLNYVCNT